MTDTIKPTIREPLEVIYDDERRETIIIKRLSNTDMIKWADTGLDKAFLVFRSVEFSSAGVSPANQLWFDTLSQDSAFAVVEKALTLNHSPIQKKIMEAVLANLRSWLSAMPSTSSAPAVTTPTN
ncbi:MAG TPA: hypothetical protein VNL17_08645 [Verrucomicrobiae bacterium]|nr:hypothetical protein [Verrucomicrobiae bacterium]